MNISFGSFPLPDIESFLALDSATKFRKVVPIRLET